MIKKKLCIGTSNFGFKYGIDKSKVNLKEINKILRFSINNQIKYLDTSPSYNNYKILKKTKIDLKKFNIISKLSLNYIKKKNIDILKYIPKIIKFLRINQFEAVLIHNAKDLKKKEGIEFLNNLILLKKKKIIKKIGISLYTVDEFNFIKKKFNFDLIQFPLNFFDRSFIQKNIQNYMKKNKIEIHIRSIFLQNLLLKPVDQLNRYFKKWNPLLFKWEKWHIKNNQKKIDTCLSFINKHKFVNKYVVGLDNLEQLKEIINFRRRKIPKNLKINDIKFTKPYLWKVI